MLNVYEYSITSFGIVCQCKREGADRIVSRIIGQKDFYDYTAKRYITIDEKTTHDTILKLLTKYLATVEAAAPTKPALTP